MGIESDREILEHIVYNLKDIQVGAACGVLYCVFLCVCLRSVWSCASFFLPQKGLGAESAGR